MSDTVRQQAERGGRQRVMARADRLAALSETADALTRVYLSPEHLQANQLVGQWMQAAWHDGVAGTASATSADVVKDNRRAPAVLRAHLDIVQRGRYDGMLGVLAAIEVVQRLPPGGDGWRRQSRSSALAMKGHPLWHHPARQSRHHRHLA